LRNCWSTKRGEEGEDDYLIRGKQNVWGPTHLAARILTVILIFLARNDIKKERRGEKKCSVLKEGKGRWQREFLYFIFC